jgi:hypothetical protein
MESEVSRKEKRKAAQKQHELMNDPVIAYHIQ